MTGIEKPTQTAKTACFRYSLTTNRHIFVKKCPENAPTAYMKICDSVNGGQVEKTHKTPRPPDKGDDVQIHRQVTEQKTARAMTPPRSEKEDKYDRIIRTNPLFSVRVLRCAP